MLVIELSGISLGVLARVFFPWVRKLRSGKATRFTKRCLYSAIGSVIVGMIIAVLIFPKFDVGTASEGAEKDGSQKRQWMI